MLLLVLACNEQSVKVLPTNEPPTAEIIALAPNQSFKRGDQIQVCGIGSDFEDGLIAPGWELDGTPVAFASVEGCGDDSSGGVLEDLAVGTYTLTAIVEDSGGETAFDEIIFSVVASDPPLVEIIDPENSTIWVAGEAGSLSALVEDDVGLPEVADWSSDLEGTLGISSVEEDGSTGLLVQLFTPGTHTLTVSVQDADGQTAEDSINLLICLDTDGDGVGDCVDWEECDGVDNNGDGAVDEGFPDTDGDEVADCQESEECDGLDNDGNGRIDEGFPDSDFDGTADCMDIESCDGVDNNGDGSVDEGFPDSDGDGIADCMDTGSTSCASYGTGNSALSNPDFETGTSSSWTFDAGVSISSFVYGGMYAAESNGNHYIQQTFTAVPVSSLVKASFWTWHEGNDYPAMYVEWGYSDGSTGNTLLYNSMLSGWVEVNLLPLMTSGKSVQRIQVWAIRAGEAMPISPVLMIFCSVTK